MATSAAPLPLPQALVALLRGAGTRTAGHGALVFEEGVTKGAMARLLRDVIGSEAAGGW